MIFVKVLGVEPGATKAEVKSAYLVKARELHPDNQISGDLERFKKVQEAMEFLQKNRFQTVIKESRPKTRHYATYTDGKRTSTHYQDPRPPRKSFSAYLSYCLIIFRSLRNVLTYKPLFNLLAPGHFELRVHQTLATILKSEVGTGPRPCPRNFQRIF